MTPQRAAWKFALVCGALVWSGCQEPEFQFKTEREWLASFQGGTTADRVWAAAALGELGLKRADSREAMVRALDDSVADVRVAAAKAIAVVPPSQERRERILQLLWTTAPQRTRAGISALEALALEPYRDGRSVPLLVNALRDSLAETRATAALTLGRLGKLGTPALAALHGALRDTSQMVRTESSHAIRSISGERIAHQ
jgi:HEAT repeat protein